MQCCAVPCVLLSAARPWTPGQLNSPPAAARGDRAVQLLRHGGRFEIPGLPSVLCKSPNLTAACWTRFPTWRRELLLSCFSSLPAPSGRFGAAETSPFPAGRSLTSFGKRPLVCPAWATESAGNVLAGGLEGMVVPLGHRESPGCRVWRLVPRCPASPCAPRQEMCSQGWGRGASGSVPGWSRARGCVVQLCCPQVCSEDGDWWGPSRASPGGQDPGLTGVSEQCSQHRELGRRRVQPL